MSSSHHPHQMLSIWHRQQLEMYLRPGSVLVGRGKQQRGEILLGDHLELRILSPKVSVVVEVASSVRGLAGWRSRVLGTACRLGPSVLLDGGDTRRDVGVGREDGPELAPEGRLALDVGVSVGRSVVLCLVQEGSTSSECHRAGCV